jgi:hypothetical protein
MISKKAINRKRLMATLLPMVAMSSLASEVRADVLPDPVLIGTYGFNSKNGTYTYSGVSPTSGDGSGAGNHSITGTGNQGSGSTSGLLSIAPVPEVYAETSATVINFNDFAQGFADLQIRYNFEILGAGPPGTTVPVLVQASGTTSSTLGGSGLAELDVQSGQGGNLFFQADSQDGHASNGYDQTFTVNGIYNLFINTQYVVVMTADTQASAANPFGSLNAQGTALVDPMFTIDPSLQGYTLLFSNGVDNATLGAVPEPSTWAMLLIGFAGLGFAAHRRQSKQAVRAT